MDFDFMEKRIYRAAKWCAILCLVLTIPMMLIPDDANSHCPVSPVQSGNHGLDPGTPRISFGQLGDPNGLGLLLSWGFSRSRDSCIQVCTGIGANGLGSGYYCNQFFFYREVYPVLVSIHHGTLSCD